MSEEYLTEELEELKRRVLRRLDVTRENKDEQLMEIIDGEISEYGREKLLPLSQRHKMRSQIFYALRKLDVLQELLEQEEVTEIMVNGAGKIFYEKEEAFIRGTDIFPPERDWRILFSRWWGTTIV